MASLHVSSAPACACADIHVAGATVIEALQLSAALRLPATLSTSERADIVQDVMSMVELNPMKDRLVGVPGAVTHVYNQALQCK